MLVRVWGAAGGRRGRCCRRPGWRRRSRSARAGVPPEQRGAVAVVGAGGAGPGRRRRAAGPGERAPGDVDRRRSEWRRRWPGRRGTRCRRWPACGAGVFTRWAWWAPTARVVVAVSPLVSERGAAGSWGLSAGGGAGRVAVAGRCRSGRRDVDRAVHVGGEVDGRGGVAGVAGAAVGGGRRRGAAAGAGRRPWQVPQLGGARRRSRWARWRCCRS